MMFRSLYNRLLIFIRDWIDRMLSPNEIKKVFNIDDSLLSSEMTTAIKTWGDLYVNQAAWVNNDPIKPVKSMQLPSTIAGEIARLVTLEMKLDLSGGARAEFLASQVDPILTDIKQIVEQGSAKGGVIFKPYPSERSLQVDVVYADAFFPVKYGAGKRLTGCIFSDVIKRGGYFYTRLEYHQLGVFQDGNGNRINGCMITNAAFRSSSENDLGQSIPLTAVEEWKDLQSNGIVRGAKQLLVGYFKPPIANNIEPSSPLGVSCYSRAVDLIEQADKQWSQLIWEFASGERAIYADETAFPMDATTGKPKLPNNRLYRTLQATGPIGEKNQLFQEWSPEFRDASIRSGLNDILKRIEFNCGLAYGTLSDPMIVERTATEIVNARQRSASTVVDNQKALKDALDDLLYGMSTWMDAVKMPPSGSYQASYSFDDSIIVDRQAQFTQDSLSVGQKTMSRVEFRMRNYGETEAVARKRIEEIDADSANRIELFTSPLDQGA